MVSELYIMQQDMTSEYESWNHIQIGTKLTIARKDILEYIQEKFSTINLKVVSS